MCPIIYVFIINVLSIYLFSKKFECQKIKVSIFDDGYLFTFFFSVNICKGKRNFECILIGPKIESGNEIGL